MESVNQKDVEYVESKEGATLYSSKEKSEEIIRQDNTLIEDLQKESTTFDNPNQTHASNDVYTPKKKNPSSASKEDDRIVEKTTPKNVNEINAETDYSTDVCSSYPKNLQADELEKQTLSSEETKLKTECSYDPNELRDITESDLYFTGKNTMSSNVGGFESELVMKKDFTAAAVITQQNYENLLRSQTQDLKNDEKISQRFQYDDAEGVNDQETHSIHSPENKSNTDTLFDKPCENDMKKIEKDEVAKEIFSISDDSLESITPNDNHNILDSPHSSKDANVVIDVSTEKAMSNQVEDVINIDDDESQSADESIEDSKNSESDENNKIYEVRGENILALNYETDKTSKESDIKTAGRNIEDLEGDNYTQTENSGSGNNTEEKNMNEENTLSIESPRTNRKETFIEEETTTTNNDNKVPLKVNGDYKLFPSPVYLKDKSIETNVAENQKTSGAFNQHKRELHSDNEKTVFVKSMDIEAESKYETNFSSHLVNSEDDISRIENEDERSHGSSPAYAASNTTDTSSSHQLVIDHAMEEFDGGISVPNHETVNGGNNTLMQANEKSEKVNILKRKLSSSSEQGMSPQRKQQHFELVTNKNENIDEVFQILENPTDKNNTPDMVLQPFKSLLLQRLQRPYSPPPPAETFMSPISITPLLPHPRDKSTFNISPSVLPTTVSSITENIRTENIRTTTKYLCFKCKTGCFDSFTALNEHQRECLADTRLLPTRISDINNILPCSVTPDLATPPPSASPEVTADMTITDVVSKDSIPTVIRPLTPPTIQRKRYYKCSSCNTFHENWNLFLHIRDKHERHMCIYCIRFFPTAEKLSVHLEIKHDLEQIHFNSEEALRQSVPLIDGVVSERRFLMCCTCQHLFTETEPFSDHNCADFMKPCTLCGQKGRHSNQCKAHPDAKRTSRTKKKLKKAIEETTKAIPSSSKSHNSISENSLAETNLNQNSINCDNRQPTPIASAGFQTAPIELLHNENSNSSSNMVIDESCTTTHSILVNPFKELDERWRLEQQSQNINEGNIFAAADLSPNESKLIVPKFKLRVPKEFQKSVDAALSSTDSDEGEEDEEHVDHGTETVIQGEILIHKNDNIVAGPTSGLIHLNNDNSLTISLVNDQPLSQRRIEDDSSQETRSIDKEEWIDETNPNLVRILQEIERTKLDIQRTKETLHHAPKLKQVPPDEPMTTSQQSGRNWTPTPPSSPKQTRCLLQLPDCQEENNSNMSDMKPEAQHSPHVQRKDSQGSDAMDIDETITGPTSEQPRRETIDDKSQNMHDGKTTPELSTSSEFKSSLNILSNSLNITASSNNKEKDMEADDSSIKQEDSLSNFDKTMAEIVETSHATQLSDSKESVLDNPADGIEFANEDVPVVDLQLDRPLEKIEVVEFIRICLKAVYPLCLYCNHARRIAVNGQSLVLHMLAQHRFSATVDSITAEELKPDTISTKMKTYLPVLENEYFNSSSYCTLGEGMFTRHFNERIFECFQCRFVTSTHKELYLHNRKMHLKTAILCFMCRANFFSFSEILCHICPGAPHKTPVFDVKYRCCLCDAHNIPSPFRLMVHLRKRHFACDVCLEDCRDQGRLSSHVWKHKLHHLCYRCGIAYRNKMDITKHLFWKHGTESIICKRCLQKRWRHVYHFCVPPITFNCDVCNLCFSKAMYLNVHKRLHSGDLRYPCTEENCYEKFISRKLLLKHTSTHLQQDTTDIRLVELGNIDEEKKFVEIGKELEVDSVYKQSEHEMEKDKPEEPINIKKEVTETISEAESPVKCEESECKADVNAEVGNIDDFQKGKLKSSEEKCADTPRKKRKKNKRSRESLEDLNLTAPNLSETDSSDESDIEKKSRGDENSIVPKVMLSSPSEGENDVGKETKSVQKEKYTGEEIIDSEPAKVLEIWKNLLQTQQTSASSETIKETKLKTYDDEDKNHIQNLLKAIYADHDYCQIYRPPTPDPPTAVEKGITVTSLSPTKRSKLAKSPRRSSNRRSASSSSSGSSSSSDSSCSCGTNCSCSSSESDSSSSSASSDDSDLSVASKASHKRHRKKSERERLRKKSESASPFKKHTISETVNVVDVDLAHDVDVNATTERLPSPPKEPLFYESDLETAESETDEEFYDEHPQKLASELLAQKRAQLMARTFLSPSHNFDIVENSRPSTPSLPEDVVCETRVKLKKKKRDRKSSGKMNIASNASLIINTKGEKKSHIEIPPISISNTDYLPHYELSRSTSLIAESPMAHQPNITIPLSSLSQPTVEQLTPRPITHHLPGRLSEGSSCSDVDGSLKRSKRARRPNKFYGYTSDDENSNLNFGQPLMMGMRAIKPQPPPQLTWRKEDLPTPSKSIVNPKSKAVRTPKTPSTPVSSLNAITDPNSPATTSAKKKRISGNGDKTSTSKRIFKKTSTNKLPPIPTLKIRPLQLGIGNDIGSSGNTSRIYSSSRETDDDDDENNSSEVSSDVEVGAVLTKTSLDPTASTSNLWNNNLQQATTSSAVNTPVLQLTSPVAAPPPRLPLIVPTPQVTVFNHKIPPALLPNPNFETLQYFKANNIRYPIRPPAGARQAREGESVYCYCRCPYDEVSEMIACDGENCLIEWFHFECVGIMVAPQGKWFCAECRPKYSEELYPTSGNV